MRILLLPLWLMMRADGGCTPMLAVDQTVGGLVTSADKTATVPPIVETLLAEPVVSVTKSSPEVNNQARNPYSLDIPADQPLVLNVFTQESWSDQTSGRIDFELTVESSASSDEVTSTGDQNPTWAVLGQARLAENRQAPLTRNDSLAVTVRFKSPGTYRLKATLSTRVEVTQPPPDEATNQQSNTIEILLNVLPTATEAYP